MSEQISEKGHCRIRAAGPKREAKRATVRARRRNQKRLRLTFDLLSGRLVDESDRRERFTKGWLS